MTVQGAVTARNVGHSASRDCASRAINRTNKRSRSRMKLLRQSPLKHRRRKDLEQAARVIEKNEWAIIGNSENLPNPESNELKRKRRVVEGNTSQ